MRTIVLLMVAFPLAAIAASQPVPETAAVMALKNDLLEYAITADATVTEFTDRRNRTNYCDPKSKTRFAHIIKGGKTFVANAASFSNGMLTVAFADTDVTAAFRVTVRDLYLTFEVRSLTGAGVDRLIFADTVLRATEESEPQFAGCAIALNLLTNVPEMPGANRRTRAICYSRFGFEGAKVAIIGCPTSRLRKVLQEVISDAPDLPHSKLGGPWALDSKANYGSYLFNMGDLSEEKVDDWIALARSLGINQIDFHGGTSFRFGDCEPNPKTYPRGRASFKAVIDKLHKAGILAGLHTYAFFMAKNSPWVTPVPDKRLAKDAAFTLAEPLTPKAATVPVEETTEAMSAITGFGVRNSVTLQIDDELIVYSDISKRPPYAFTKCKRGAHGTKAAEHAKGVRVHHLRECFGLFVPDGDSSLLTEVAAKTADMFNECGFDMIYLDALDGEDVIAGAENGWHYGTKFVYEICKRLKRPAIMEMSTFRHHLWCVRSRGGAWDHPTRSHKKFVDIHCAANESFQRMFLPSHLGWWAFKTWRNVQEEPTFSDDIEYLCAKALGNNCGLSIMGITPETAPKIPALPRLASIVKQYEELRRANYFPESVKKQLREPGENFELVEQPGKKWAVRRMEYSKHKVTGLHDSSNHWTLTNRFEAQPIQLRIEALYSTAAYDAPESIDLTGDLNSFTNRSASRGITVSISPSSDVAKAGLATVRLAATNTTSGRERTWAMMGKTLSPVVNLNSREAMGVWIHGDGKGELLNFQLRSPSHMSRAQSDHYVDINFKGWRYFELVEPEGERHAEHKWPYGDIYSIYRESTRPQNIETLNLFWNSLPAKDSVTCYITPVRALPLVKTRICNPTVTIHGRSITFPVEFETGSYLEFKSMSDCKLYGTTGEFVSNVTPHGDAPEVQPGTNQVLFACTHEGNVNPRAKVTMITAGPVLKKE